MVITCISCHIYFSQDFLVDWLIALAAKLLVSELYLLLFRTFDAIASIFSLVSLVVLL